MTDSKNPTIVYVVDDDSSVRKALERLLRSAGHSVKTFASAEEFLSSNYHSDNSCLVLDIHLKGMSGLVLQKHLLQDGILIPIVFITSHPDVGIRPQVEKTGSSLLRKPFQSHRLLEAIEIVMSNGRWLGTKVP